MNVIVERYFIPIIHSDTRIFNFNFVFSVHSYFNPNFRVVQESSGEIIKEGFSSLDDALDFVRYHEYILSND
jgi:hypothetical protein